MMTHRPIEFREERDLGQKLNVTFAFIKQNYKVLLTSLLYLVVPFALLAGIFSGIYQSTQLAQAAGEVEYESMGAYSFASSILSVHYWLQIFFTIVAYVMLSLTVYSFMVLYQDYDGPIEVRDVWALAKGHIIPVLYSTIGVFIICVLGTLLLVVPGVYLYVAFSIFIVVMLREDVGFVEAMERCLYLVKGNWWSSFGFFLVLIIIQGVFGFVASAPAIVTYILRILHLPGGENDLLLVAAGTVSTVVNLLLYIIWVTGLGFQYYHLVEVKDGIGLLEQVENIGKPEPALATISEQEEA
ncbi:hypothetical protein [Rufibacter sp. LB8]|uniref:hypothetical protein n=1 Tax=Rufibacter sp. LB8 TaxID=2777781 RepID=UPI00178C52F5|nr:hypothetical protein [Rufibacter sp. LB8]